MVVDNSNKSYTKAIAGILIMIAVVVIIAALILGVVGSKNYTDKYVRSSKTDTSYASAKEDSVKTLNNQQGNDKLVPESKRGCCDTFVDWDTCPGTIDIAIDQDPDYCVPVCINDDNYNSFLAELNQALNITATVCGGYTPKDYWSDLILSQYGSAVAHIDIDWQLASETCCTKIWEAVFVGIDEMQDGYGTQGAECVVFDASVLPIVTPDCMVIEDACWPETYKDISLELEIKWTGCHFWTILASDLHFPKSPTPDL